MFKKMLVIFGVVMSITLVDPLTVKADTINWLEDEDGSNDNGNEDDNDEDNDDDNDEDGNDDEEDDEDDNNDDEDSNDDEDEDDEDNNGNDKNDDNNGEDDDDDNNGNDENDEEDDYYNIINDVRSGFVIQYRRDLSDISWKRPRKVTASDIELTISRANGVEFSDSDIRIKVKKWEYGWIVRVKHLKDGKKKIRTKGLWFTIDQEILEGLE